MVNSCTCAVLLVEHDCAVEEKMQIVQNSGALTLSLPRGLPLMSKSSGVRQSKIYKVTLWSERVKGDSFLAFSLPRGLPLTSKIVWH